MRLTLIFDIFNKQESIDGILRSWLSTLSNAHEIELILVFDALRDQSAVIATQTVDDYPQVDTKFIFTDDVFEVKANNEGLKQATGEIVVFCQDDCSMYTPEYDDMLAFTFEEDAHLAGKPIGAVGLLAGVQMTPTFGMNRIECHRPHKDERAWVHGIGVDTYPLGIYQVDVICRPFAVRTNILRQYGGLDEAYCPMDWDDADLCFKLLRDGYANLYVPFDLLNTSAKHETMTRDLRNANFAQGEALAKQRYGEMIRMRESDYQLLLKLVDTDDGLVLA